MYRDCASHLLVIVGRRRRRRRVAEPKRVTRRMRYASHAMQPAPSPSPNAEILQYGKHSRLYDSPHPNTFCTSSSIAFAHALPPTITTSRNVSVMLALFGWFASLILPILVG